MVAAKKEKAPVGGKPEANRLDLIRALKAVKPFASKEPERYVLCGVLVESGPDGFRFTTTNGHVIARVTVPIQSNAPSEWKRIGFVRNSHFGLAVETLKVSFEEFAEVPCITSSDPGDDEAEKFPDVNGTGILRPVDGKGEAVPRIGLNPAYAALIGHVGKALRINSCKVGVAKADEPIRVDMLDPSNGVRAEIAIMPMRI